MPPQLCLVPPPHQPRQLQHFNQVAGFSQVRSATVKNELRPWGCSGEQVREDLGTELWTVFLMDSELRLAILDWPT